MINKGTRLAEGKTKIIYAHPDDSSLVYMEHKDSITAGDGVKRNSIEGKAKYSCLTTSNVYRLLERKGIPTHYVDTPGDDLMLVRACTMIPVEVVMRRLATGSYLKRHPETTEGTRFDPVLVEYFLKDDARHDPQIFESDLVPALVSNEELTQITDLGRQVFAILEKAWAAQDVTLVDLKIEFGRDSERKLLVADVIDNDSWRIWPGGRKELMLDKQIYRNMSEVTGEGLSSLKEKYVQVAEMTAKF